MRRRTFIYGAITVMVLAWAGTVVAQSLPRLPKNLQFPQSPDSPGVVTFSHETHLAVQDTPDCTVCHPKLFKILEPGTPLEGRPVRHALMEKKRQCGACHDGEAATGLDQCEHCHRVSSQFPVSSFQPHKLRLFALDSTG